MIVDDVKYLGMYLDEHMGVYINPLTSKLIRDNGIISKLRHYVHLKLLIQVCFAIFYSYLNYGYGIWGPESEKSLESICKLQKKVCKASSPLFLLLEILKLEDLVKLNILNFVYEYRQKVLPEELKNFYTICSEIHDHNNRFVSDSLHFKLW